ncbi:hypothetical protein HHK36_024657 [Tetracentron sinense]|uniref:Uncharacterized protein n=1 Tax=Tetracentron sinense TaxID=13715 RepID=A0A834YNH3_TETSI|nr:hypothetical protein HHK36_024657 [Tetracentron sinense]
MAGLDIDRVCKSGKKKSSTIEGMEETKRMRKIRIICCDPDATESSSSEDDERDNRKKKKLMGFKRLIGEIRIPMVPHQLSTTESSRQDSSVSHTGVSEDSESIISHTSPLSVLDVSTSDSLVCGAGNSIKEGGTSIKTAEQQQPISDILEEPLISSAIDQDLNFGSDPDFFSPIDFGNFLDGIDDLPICGFGDNKPTDLPDFDFDLSSEELAWMDGLLNIACPYSFLSS